MLGTFCILRGMQNEPTSFKALIEGIGGIPVLQSELGLRYVTAQKMYQRNRIAVRHWPKVIEVANERGIPVTADTLVRMAGGAA